MQTDKNKPEEHAGDSMLYLPKLAAEIITLLDTHRRLTIAEIHSHTQANRNTIRKTVKDLADWGFLRKHGSTKGAWYTKPLP